MHDRCQRTAHRDTADIPGAFMQADIDESLHMKLEGPGTTINQSGPETIRKVYHDRKGQTSAVRTANEGSIRNSSSGATVLAGSN
jgi:hypothetical protein